MGHRITFLLDRLLGRLGDGQVRVVAQPKEGVHAGVGQVARGARFLKEMACFARISRAPQNPPAKFTRTPFGRIHQNTRKPEWGEGATAVGVHQNVRYKSSPEIRYKSYKLCNKSRTD